jgi:hypothetical protein
LRPLLALLSVQALITLLMWFDIDRDIAKAGRRIREIEARVNGGIGEPVLEWETKQGRGGLIGKWFLRSDDKAISSSPAPRQTIHRLRKQNKTLMLTPPT